MIILMDTTRFLGYGTNFVCSKHYMYAIITMVYVINDVSNIVNHIRKEGDWNIMSMNRYGYSSNWIMNLN